MLGYETDDFGWTAIWPGSGFLGDLFDRPFLARWELDGGVARSEQVPGVAVPACVHAGVIGVAPSRELFEPRAGARRPRRRRPGIARRSAPRQGLANPPSPEHAWPPEAADGLRTYPPRENGGNMDIRDLGPGARLWLPVHVQGALLSVGDLHFAQGDGEVCISAIETGGAATFRVGLRRGSEGGWRPRFPCYEAPPRPPRAMFATTGIPLADDGSQGDLDLNLATRRALLELLGWLEHERGLERGGRLRADERGGRAARVGARGRAERAGVGGAALGRVRNGHRHSVTCPRARTPPVGRFPSSSRSLGWLFG